MIHIIASNLQASPDSPIYESKEYKGKFYSRNSLLLSIEQFNLKCPKKGGILNRQHIQHTGPYTHITHGLFLNDNYFLCAKIELLDENIKINEIALKPLIITPCTFDNNQLEIIKEIINIQIEVAQD